jgi:hypothetical protein
MSRSYRCEVWLVRSEVRKKEVSLAGFGRIAEIEKSEAEKKSEKRFLGKNFVLFQKKI